MAEYKVPQDVEADDKLLGPFSFRQFIYLIVVAVSIGLGWGLYMLFPPLVIIPLPIVIFFGALALPLRKDQPMEIYLAAIMSFYLKPRKRFWTPDGIESLVEITAPRTVEAQRTKNLSQTEAEQRLSYLASLSDTRGWAVRNISQPDTAMNSDLYFEAQQTQDVLDENNTISQNLGHMIDQTDARRRQDMINRMKNPQPAPAQPAQTHTPGPGQYVIPNQQAMQQPAMPPIPDPYASLPGSNPQPGVQQSQPSTWTPQPAAPQPYTQPFFQQAPAQQQGAQQPVPQPAQVNPFIQPQQPVQPTAYPQQPQVQQSQPQVTFNPYPTNMNQMVIQPLSPQAAAQPPQAQQPSQLGAQPPQAETSTSEKPISPDIINLANNSDLSIETLAREAKRIHEKEANLEEEEVVISLH